MDTKTVVDSIVNILKTRRFDQENLDQTYRVNGKWLNPSDTLKVIKRITRKPKTNTYEVDYRINHGFLYSLSVDSVNKNSARGYVLSEMGDGTEIVNVRRTR